MQLLVPHQQFAKSIEPRVRDLHHPTPRASALGSLRALFAARSHMRRVVLHTHLMQRRVADESGVGAQVLRGARRDGRSRDHDRVQGGRQLTNIMAIRADHDE